MIQNVIDKLMKFIGVIFVIIILYVLGNTIIGFYLQFGLEPFKILFAFITAVAVFGYLLKSKHISRKLFMVILCALSIIIKLVWIYKVRTVPESDFYLIHWAAQKIYEGNVDIVKSTPYFYTWVYQMPFVMFEYIFISIFKENSVAALKIVNVLVQTGTVLLVYLIVEKLKNDIGARIISTMYCLYIPTIVYTSILTNQLLSIMLFCLGIFILIKKDVINLKVMALVGFILALGNLIRPEGILFIASITIYLVSFYKYDFSKNTITKDFIHRLRFISVMVIVYWATLGIFNFVFMEFGLTDYKIENRNSLYKFVVGLNHGTRGTYSVEDAKLLEEYSIGQELYEKEKSLIVDRLKDKGRLYSLFKEKFKIMWTDIDWSFDFAKGGADIDVSFLLNLKFLERVQYMIVLTLAIVGVMWEVVKLYRKKEESNGEMWLFISFIGIYLFAYLLIEVQPRYRQVMMPVLFILASYGLLNLNQYIQLKKN